MDNGFYGSIANIPFLGNVLNSRVDHMLQNKIFQGFGYLAIFGCPIVFFGGCWIIIAVLTLIYPRYFKLRDFMRFKFFVLKTFESE